MTIDQYGIHLGFLYIRFYALIAITGALFASWLTARRAMTHGLDATHVWDGLFWALVPGLIGARLYHVLTPSPSMWINGQNPYVVEPLRIFAIWEGGLGIYGAIVGGALGIYLYARRHDQPLLKWIDMVVPGLAFAQAIGRWGNFVNHELYGAPTTLPWAIYIPPANRLPGYEAYSTFHPLFLYESLWNIAAGLFLLWLDRKYSNWLKPGDLLLIYLMEYPLIRFLLDFIRLDSNGFGALTTAQVVSLITFLVAGGVLIWRHRQPAQRQTAAEGL
ncbi:MAG: prolipoprotein diacylglyceryl transferase [Anaerolineae bacterium]|nr:prolipoprotein diacylglyceryl transferase [Anaerolineae bacterium]